MFKILAQKPRGCGRGKKQPSDSCLLIKKMRQLFVFYQPNLNDLINTFKSNV